MSNIQMVKRYEEELPKMASSISWDLSGSELYCEYRFTAARLLEDFHPAHASVRTTAFALRFILNPESEAYPALRDSRRLDIAPSALGNVSEG
jgi:hypothetical protein